MNKMLLSGLANAHPLLRVAAKYWWLAIPAGWAMWTLTKKREKVDAAGLIQDFGISFGPVLPLILLAEMTLDREQRQAQAPVGLQGPIKEASFAVRPSLPAPQPAGQAAETLAGDAFPPQFMAQ